MLRRASVAASVCLGVLGTGCVSVSHVQTADTLGQGRFQFAIEPGVGGAAVLAGDSDEGLEGESDTDALYYPHLDLALRFGVTDRVDLGVRFGSSLAELQSKFLLTHPDNPHLAVSLAPSLMGVFLGDDSDVGSYVNVALPVLVGFKTPGGSELVLGPRVSATRISGSSATESVAVNLVSVGASVGYALRVTNGFRLMPEVGVSVPVIGEFNSTDSDSEVGAGFGGGFVQFKLGFLFGAGRPIRRDAAPAQEHFVDI